MCLCCMGVCMQVAVCVRLHYPFKINDEPLKLMNVCKKDYNIEDLYRLTILFFGGL